MASHEDLQNDWSTLCQECHSCWTQSDLQLAAELGKTLLERNKELENCIKLHQSTIDDQTQEIEYMKKQTAALREVNDSRLKIYEQLEVSIQDLERANQKLALDNINDKKQIKSQCLTIDTLEARLDELQKKFDEVKIEYESILRKQQIKDQSTVEATLDRTPSSRDGSTQYMSVLPKNKDPENNETIRLFVKAMASAEDVSKIQQNLQESRFQCALEQKRVNELEEQRDTLIQENAQLEEQLNNWKAKAQGMKNLQDEINMLEEVRQGYLCGRCLRSTNSCINENLPLMLDEEDDDISLVESLASSMRNVDTTLQELNVNAELFEEDNSNPYRVLVEKYEALLKVYQKSNLHSKYNGLPDCMSLQQELQMSGELGKRETNRSSAHTSKKIFTTTSTDFSEAETSSSGFSDETSNKFTQTEGRLGSLLCSIADGEDCKFSIYDDSSTFESRFHKTPEYRKLFTEIFEVLKHDAVAKDEGRKLPLLNEVIIDAEKRTTYDEDCMSELTDDARSVASLAVSSIASEPIFRVRTPLFSRKSVLPLENDVATSKSTPNHIHRHQPLEYLSLQVKKKGSAKKSTRRSSESGEISITSDIIPTANPRIIQLKGSSRRRFRPLTACEISDGIWNGNTAHFYASRSPHNRQQRDQPQNPSVLYKSDQVKSNLEYKPGTAAEEVAKLRRLEMSYAEVLRMPNKSKGGRNRKSQVFSTASKG